MRLRHVLLAILVYSVVTVWVPERWALSGLEAACFLCAAVLLCRASKTESLVRPTWRLAPLVGMCAWALAQRAAGWTEVQAPTLDAALYWLTAACLAWLGYQACARGQDRRSFLTVFLAAGSGIALLGIVQLYTSGGKIFWLFPSGFETLVIGPFVSPNNYAAFVELLVPVALVLGLGRRKSAPCLVLAAALVACVIASGSRAGAFLVIAESAAIFLLHPGTRTGRSRALVMFVVTAGACTAIVGYQFLWMRIAHSVDPYLVRREFLESSLSMIAARPFSGFGLGSWPSVYPRFAVIDPGVVANHSHNEWIQWTAEGGVPALLLMLVLAAGILRPAIRSGWGIGVLAVLLHSLVDYPFLRLGSAAWTFALIGVLAAEGASPQVCRPSRTRHLAAGVTAGLLVLAGVLALRVGRADTLFRRGTVEDVRHAIQVDPDRAEYHVALAALDSSAAVRELRRAISLNPGLTDARLRLAWDAEGRGDTHEAEELLLEATRYDRQFLPAWALANFYFRRGRTAEFWRFARRAADLSYDDLGGLFSLCWSVSPDAGEILDRVACGKPGVRRNLLAWLVAAQHTRDAGVVAARIVQHPASEDRDVLLTYTEAAHAAGYTIAARDIWQAMEPPRDSNLLANGDLQAALTQRGFDWRIFPVVGVQVARETRGGPVLHLSFSGKQREHDELVSHPLALEAGESYVLSCRYRTSGLPVSTGLYWSFGQGPEYRLDGSDEWRNVEWRFSPSKSVRQLALCYRRVEGTTRAEGSLTFAGVRIERGEVKFRRSAAD